MMYYVSFVTCDATVSPNATLLCTCTYVSCRFLSLQAMSNEQDNNVRNAQKNKKNQVNAKRQHFPIHSLQCQP